MCCDADKRASHDHPTDLKTDVSNDLSTEMLRTSNMTALYMAESR